MMEDVKSVRNLLKKENIKATEKNCEIFKMIGKLTKLFGELLLINTNYMILICDALIRGKEGNE